MFRCSLCFFGLLLISFSRQDVTDQVPYLLTINFESIYDGDRITTVCGGLMITPEWVLTPAFCVEGIRKSLLYVSSNNTFYIPLDKIVIHDKYDRLNSTYDVGMVKLTEPITNKCTNCKAIGEISQTSPVTGDDVKIIGWGYNNVSMNDYDLLTVEQTAISSKDCNDIYMDADIFPIPQTIFCINNYFTDTSPVIWMLEGGSVIKDNALVGMVDSDTGLYLPDIPGRYTDISMVRDWIEQVIKTE